jgi:hypothetical protein
MNNKPHIVQEVHKNWHGPLGVKLNQSKTHEEGKSPIYGDKNMCDCYNIYNMTTLDKMMAEVQNQLFYNILSSSMIAKMTRCRIQ